MISSLEPIVWSLLGLGIEVRSVWSQFQILLIGESPILSAFFMDFSHIASVTMPLH